MFERIILFIEDHEYAVKVCALIASIALATIFILGIICVNVYSAGVIDGGTSATNSMLNTIKENDIQVFGKVTDILRNAAK